MISVCCECKRTRLDGRWFGGRLPLNDEPVTHVYCPECFQKMMLRIDRFGRRRAAGKRFVREAPPVPAEPCALL